MKLKKTFISINVVNFDMNSLGQIIPTQTLLLIFTSKIKNNGFTYSIFKETECHLITAITLINTSAPNQNAHPKLNGISRYQIQNTYYIHKTSYTCQMRKMIQYQNLWFWTMAYVLNRRKKTCRPLYGKSNDDKNQDNQLIKGNGREAERSSVAISQTLLT